MRRCGPVRCVAATWCWARETGPGGRRPPRTPSRTSSSCRSSSYALVALVILTRKADLAFVILSWVFVATRILHAIVYCTTNEIPKRFAAFAVGVAILGVMWITFALRILVASPPA